MDGTPNTAGARDTWTVPLTLQVRVTRGRYLIGQWVTTLKYLLVNPSHCKHRPPLAEIMVINRRDHVEYSPRDHTTLQAQVQTGHLHGEGLSL